MTFIPAYVKTLGGESEMLGLLLLVRGCRVVHGGFILGSTEKRVGVGESGDAFQVPCWGIGLA